MGAKTRQLHSEALAYGGELEVSGKLRSFQGTFVAVHLALEASFKFISKR